MAGLDDRVTQANSEKKDPNFKPKHGESFDSAKKAAEGALDQGKKGRSAISDAAERESRPT